MGAGQCWCRASCLVSLFGAAAPSPVPGRKGARFRCKAGRRREVLMQDGDVRQVVFKMAEASRSDRERSIPPLCAVGTIACLFQMYLFLDTSSF